MSSVDHPAHYGGEDNPYEHVKVMEAILTRDEFVGAMKYLITKYLHRERGKAGIEDVLKARWYMIRLAAYMAGHGIERVEDAPKTYATPGGLVGTVPGLTAGGAPLGGHGGGGGPGVPQSGPGRVGHKTGF